MFHESLGLSRQLANPHLTAEILHNIGRLALVTRDYPEARRLLRQALEAFRELGEAHGQAVTLISIADVARAMRDWPAAQDLYVRSLLLLRQVGDAAMIAGCAGNYAALLCETGAAGAATRLLAAANVIEQQTGQAQSADAQQEEQQLLEQLKGALGERCFQGEWAAGRAMSTEEVIDYAVSIPPPASPSPGVQTGDSI
jgi:tetratricopeptide (TPR) repeat protein